MATNYNGMFGNLYKNVQAEDQAEDQRLRTVAQMDPAAQHGYAALSGASMAGKGLGRTVATVAGKDARTSEERLRDAMKAVGELGDVDLNTPEGVDTYYKNVINTLRQHGLPGEAHAAAQEWNKYKSDQMDQQLKRDDLNRKAEADRLRAANLAETNRIKAERNRQLAEQGLPEFVQLVNRADAMPEGPMRTAYVNRINQQAGGKIKLEEAGDRILVRNERGDLLGVDMVGEKPMNEKDRLKADEKKKALDPAYKSAMLTLQTQYKAAIDMYNSAGLDDLIGKWTGLAARYGEKDGILSEAGVARLSPEGQEALGVYQQIMGGAFVNALKSLKEAGGGSTGLGQVTEIEGKKITTATNALFPRQQPASFRRKLADYISTLEQSAAILADKAKEDGLQPIGLNVVEMTGPVKGQPQTYAPTAPRGPATAPADGDKVRVMRPDGVTGTIPRAKLEAFKRKGYKEIQ